MKKTAVVTGSSRGIGFAIARQLGLDGFNVVMVATGSKEKNADAVKKLEDEGITVGYVQANVADHDDRLRIVKEAVELFGRIDVLVNNAGVAPLVRADLLDMTEESFDRVIGINTKGNMFLTQAVANQMISQEAIEERRKGVIVNISSCSSVVSSTSRGEYCVSKAGISMLTTLYADRLASEGILVHEVRPGVIATDMTSTVQAKYDKLIADGLFPIARWGTPEDVAGAVSALVSDKFLYTTGNYVDVDGGFHIKKL
ncbi:MAG: 3-ketoacyl-ACP reductase [Spirochaetales bacterium]|nr:3-ketoacyl-ACP reductase [Candidatus Physcosoma equi]